LLEFIVNCSTYNHSIFRCVTGEKIEKKNKEKNTMNEFGVAFWCIFAKLYKNFDGKKKGSPNVSLNEIRNETGNQKTFPRRACNMLVPVCKTSVHFLKYDLAL
jgi:hypothetical protein